MTECQRCDRHTDLWLCSHCQSGLRELLLDLPAWLSWVAEAETGHVRLGDGGRSNRRDVVTEYADPAPAYDAEGFALGITKGQQRLERDLDDGALTLPKVLAMGRVNAAATRLLHTARDTLSTAARDLCETRGLEVPPLTAPPGFIGPLPPGWRHGTEQRNTGTLVCHWLAAHVSAIACEDSAAARYAEIEIIRERAERVVNRPVPRRFIGPCPTPAGSRECGRMLEARPGEIEITCPGCDHTHNVEQLTTRLFNNAYYMAFTVRELVETVLPRLGDPISRATIYRWISIGALASRGERAPGQPQEGEPQYLLADVRRLRATRGRRLMTAV